MMIEEDCDLLIKNNEKIRKLLEKGNANKYLTFKEINATIDNMDTDVMDILFQLLSARKIAIVEDKREFESLSKNQNKIDEAARFIHVEDKVGNNDDPIRLYLKEIGVDLIKKDITREFYIRLLTLNKDATAEDALNVLGNEHIANQIRSKEKLYSDNIQEKLEELIVKIKSGDIDYRREEVLKTATLHSNEGFEAICNKAREIHLLNKQKEKLYQGSDYDD